MEIEQIEHDSRQVRKNCLFIAIKGYETDGNDFVEQAKANGAIAVMGERENCDLIDNYVQVTDVRAAMAEAAAKFYGYPGKSVKVCGVTGTNGKTTTCYLLKYILESRDKKVGLITSNIYDTGKEQFKAERTTPESLDLQRLLYLMKKNYCVNAIIEVSSHSLMLHRVDAINFCVAIFTNITRDHLDFHKSMEEYLNAKAKLLSKLDGALSYAVINIDQPEFKQFFGDFNSSYISYSLSDPSADIYCSSYEIGPDKTTFDLVTPMGTRTIVLKLPGKFNLRNAIAAASGGFACGIDIDNIVKGLEKAKPVEGRFNYVQCNQPFSVYVDFAHTPDAIKRLCEAAREVSKGRLLILFGCGGDRDKGKRPLMGQVATETANFTVVTSDNPRSEDMNEIIEDIKPGLSGDNYQIIPDRADAIKTILKMAQPGDVVLLAGKGSENYQEIKGERIPFSDVEEATRILGELGFKSGEEID